MTSIMKSTYTSQQIVVWLKGLLALAWADGHFDREEQELIADLISAELAPNLDFQSLERITPTELATTLGRDRHIAENFLRTAVMVAVADGVYSPSEHDLLVEYSQTLGLNSEVLESLEHTLCDHPLDQPEVHPPEKIQRDLLRPVRHWLDHIEIHDPRVARFLCKMIPPQCPFERDIQLFGHKIVHIPPMCKLNPLYDQLVSLRFRALSYLADECGEDISSLCS